MVSQERSFRVICETFEVNFSSVVVFEGQVEFSSKTDGLLETWILFDAIVDHLQTLIDLTYLSLSVPSLFRAIADSRIALGLL